MVEHCLLKWGEMSWGEMSGGELSGGEMSPAPYYMVLLLHISNVLKRLDKRDTIYKANLS